MTACKYFENKNCPEESPSDARCQICISLLTYGKGNIIGMMKPKKAKLPQK